MAESTVKGKLDAPKKGARMAISVRTRFEIFKRDNFTCRYCGKKSPEVVLELDHVLAVSKGGTDDPMNLVTSCYECNSGKSDKPLSEIITGEDPHDKAIELLEKERQLAEYERIRGEAEKRYRSHLEWLQGQFTLDDEMWRFVRAYLKEFSVYDLRDAIQSAIDKTGDRYPHNIKYFCGIVRSWREQQKAAQSNALCEKCGKELGITGADELYVFCSADCLTDAFRKVITDRDEQKAKTAGTAKPKSCLECHKTLAVDIPADYIVFCGFGCWAANNANEDEEETT